MYNIIDTRKIYGMNMAICPKEKVIDSYVDLEVSLGNIDRVRKIYQSYIEKLPENSNSWVKYAEFEKSLEEKERAECIYESAINLTLDIPEMVWKSYINMEIEIENYEKVRNLYERLLSKTKHVKVWLSYAKFESDKGDPSLMRKVYQRAIEYFKTQKMKEERALVLDNWYKNEKDEKEKEKVHNMLPQKVSMIRKDQNVSGKGENNKEEVYDYIFPNDKVESKGLQAVVNSFGSVAVAAFTATSRIEQLVHQPYTSLGTALATFTGQNYGARQDSRIKEGFKKSTIIMLTMSVILLIIMQIGGKAIVSLFVSDGAVIEMGAKGLKITSLFYAVLGMIYVTRGTQNGLGDALFAFINGIVEVVARIILPPQAWFVRSD